MGLAVVLSLLISALSPACSLAFLLPPSRLKERGWFRWAGRSWRVRCSLRRHLLLAARQAEHVPPPPPPIEEDLNEGPSGDRGPLREPSLGFGVRESGSLQSGEGESGALGRRERGGEIPQASRRRTPVDTAMRNGGAVNFLHLLAEQLDTHFGATESKRERVEVVLKTAAELRRRLTEGGRPPTLSPSLESLLQSLVSRLCSQVLPLDERELKESDLFPLALRVLAEITQILRLLPKVGGAQAGPLWELLIEAERSLHSPSSPSLDQALSEVYSELDLPTIVCVLKTWNSLYCNKEVTEALLASSKERERGGLAKIAAFMPEARGKWVNLLLSATADRLATCVTTERDRRERLRKDRGSEGEDSESLSLPPRMETEEFMSIREDPSKVFLPHLVETDDDSLFLMLSFMTLALQKTKEKKEFKHRNSTSFPFLSIDDLDRETLKLVGLTSVEVIAMRQEAAGKYSSSCGVSPPIFMACLSSLRLLSFCSFPPPWEKERTPALVLNVCLLTTAVLNMMMLKLKKTDCGSVYFMATRLFQGLFDAHILRRNVPEGSDGPLGAARLLFRSACARLAGDPRWIALSSNSRGGKKKEVERDLRKAVGVLWQFEEKNQGEQFPEVAAVFSALDTRRPIQVELEKGVQNKRKELIERIGNLSLEELAREFAPRVVNSVARERFEGRREIYRREGLWAISALVVRLGQLFRESMIGTRGEELETTAEGLPLIHPLARFPDLWSLLREFFSLFEEFGADESKEERANFLDLQNCCQTIQALGRLFVTVPSASGRVESWVSVSGGPEMQKAQDECLKVCRRKVLLGLRSGELQSVGLGAVLDGMVKMGILWTEEEQDALEGYLLRDNAKNLKEYYRDPATFCTLVQLLERTKGLTRAVMKEIDNGDVLSPESLPAIPQRDFQRLCSTLAEISRGGRFSWNVRYEIAARLEQGQLDSFRSVVAALAFLRRGPDSMRSLEETAELVEDLRAELQKQIPDLSGVELAGLGRMLERLHIADEKTLNVFAQAFAQKMSEVKSGATIRRLSAWLKEIQSGSLRLMTDCLYEREGLGWLRFLLSASSSEVTDLTGLPVVLFHDLAFIGRLCDRATLTVEKGDLEEAPELVRQLYEKLVAMVGEAGVGTEGGVRFSAEKARRELELSAQRLGREQELFWASRRSAAAGLEAPEREEVEGRQLKALALREISLPLLSFLRACEGKSNIRKSIHPFLYPLIHDLSAFIIDLDGEEVRGAWEGEGGADEGGEGKGGTEKEKKSVAFCLTTVDAKRFVERASKVGALSPDLVLKLYVWGQRRAEEVVQRAGGTNLEDAAGLAFFDAVLAQHSRASVRKQQSLKDKNSASEDELEEDEDFEENFSALEGEDVSSSFEEMESDTLVSSGTREQETEWEDVRRRFGTLALPLRPLLFDASSGVAADENRLGQLRALRALDLLFPLFLEREAANSKETSQTMGKGKTRGRPRKSSSRSEPAPSAGCFYSTATGALSLSTVQGLLKAALRLTTQDGGMPRRNANGGFEGVSRFHTVGRGLALLFLASSLQSAGTSSDPLEETLVDTWVDAAKERKKIADSRGLPLHQAQIQRSSGHQFLSSLLDLARRSETIAGIASSFLEKLTIRLENLGRAGETMEKDRIDSTEILQLAFSLSSKKLHTLFPGNAERLHTRCVNLVATAALGELRDMQRIRKEAQEELGDFSSSSAAAAADTLELDAVSPRVRELVLMKALRLVSALRSLESLRVCWTPFTREALTELSSLPTVLLRKGREVLRSLCDYTRAVQAGVTDDVESGDQEDSVGMRFLAWLTPLLIASVRKTLLMLGRGTSERMRNLRGVQADLVNRARPMSPFLARECVVSLAGLGIVSGTLHSNLVSLIRENAHDGLEGWRDLRLSPSFLGAAEEMLETNARSPMPPRISEEDTHSTTTSSSLYTRRALDLFGLDDREDLESTAAPGGGEKADGRAAAESAAFLASPAAEKLARLVLDQIGHHRLRGLRAMEETCTPDGDQLPIDLAAIRSKKRARSEPTDTQTAEDEEREGVEEDQWAILFEAPGDTLRVIDTPLPLPLGQEGGDAAGASGEKPRRGSAGELEREQVTDRSPAFALLPVTQESAGALEGDSGARGAEDQNVGVEEEPESVVEIPRLEFLLRQRRLERRGWTVVTVPFSSEEAAAWRAYIAKKRKKQERLEDAGAASSKVEPPKKPTKRAPVKLKGRTTGSGVKKSLKPQTSRKEKQTEA
uniref:Uncharacterized protein n=1 Tax=Chromera velia CCMP2878 TaxID=1169474 RepID=A0A0G4F6E3_9ALVE|eukprot:Cvel_15436.t1-p1 / transcript=Cvel_15436.t1 / gene=Cvel_15436 / organism=Chromera_velia_CCMP2878 / gene_product=hypothetical protein / transcript_product=hypothetical protein / location=Cvel_scaffold1141:40753-54406(+) / protein_length=2233 / sequence_SO=supercontig / SO=protein_coding / is_pseudo=false